MNSTTFPNLDNNEQIRLLLNLREDIRVLLSTHSKGIWFQMLPKVFYMHFNRDMPLDSFGISNPLFFIDYISDMIKYELPNNINEDDFIIELDLQRRQISDAKAPRDILLKSLASANREKRGAILREICIIDENCKHQKETIHPTHEQIAKRFQKIRSMIDICLRYLPYSSPEISSDDLLQLYHQSNEFIANLTPISQHLSSLDN
ncbi:unnamed protein product [Adineta ricciae]|uniref:Uncharacterized protein n=1 Tax=Adineta ricciae TaxID=249248 RepID=A0A813W6D8_ADIRI|nr:unnamed protein product [Adineta ricciae]CAF1107337.1 unnamed protein product [Adineta ricciae]